MPNPPTCRLAWPASPTISARFASSPNETSQTSSPGASSTAVATGPPTMPRTCWLETFSNSSADSADHQLGGQDATSEEANSRFLAEASSPLCGEQRGLFSDLETVGPG